MFFNNINRIVLIIVIAFLGCNNKNQSAIKKNDTVSISITDQIHHREVIQLNCKIIIQPSKTKLKIGDLIDLFFKSDYKSPFDSLVLKINDTKMQSAKGFPLTYKWNTSNNKIGRHTISLTSYEKGNLQKKDTTIILLSDIIPKEYSYKVLKTFPHDVHAYTQGLSIDGGILYEATGLEGQSTLRKTQLETGAVIQSYTLPQEIFGEGITLFNNKIIQISWQNKLGFVYKKDNFDLIDRFSYPTEGWGICNDGQKLIMSDGSEKLYFLEANSYSKISELEVYSNTGPVKLLNELEYIEGKVYANVYQTNNIVIIDPSNGKATGFIDLKGLLPEKDKTKETDVLNGIAYEPVGRKFYVTGKRWDKLFEIAIVEKPKK